MGGVHQWAAQHWMLTLSAHDAQEQPNRMEGKRGRWEGARNPATTRGTANIPAAGLCHNMVSLPHGASLPRLQPPSGESEITSKSPNQSADAGITTRKLKASLQAGCSKCEDEDLCLATNSRLPLLPDNKLLLVNLQP